MFTVLCSEELRAGKEETEWGEKETGRNRERRKRDKTEREIKKRRF